jgi:putative spermidine/putrescine transport system substrate-binding protein
MAALALVAAACGSSSSTGAGAAAPKVYSSIGQGEGALKLIAWNGYTEDGSNDPNYDWVTPFEQQT